MGPSRSFGRADLVTVVSKDAALADAAATALCNRVREVDTIDSALNRGMEIEGVEAVLIVLGEHIGVIGELPELVRNRDPRALGKISR
jgi:hypothetical protein